MVSSEETVEVEDSNGNSYGKLKLRLKDRSKKVAQTKEMLTKQAVQTKQILSKQAVKIAKQAEEHERFINKVTHLMGVLGFGGFCFILGARPQDVRYLYCLFYVIFVPLRWIYYRYKKWHYYLLDFCYYANTIFLIMLLCYPRNEKLFMVCFSFAEGPLAWALIVWRCSLVFNSMDKIVSVFIHLLPGLVFFTIRWWDPVYFEAMHPEGTTSRASWPYVESKSYLWTWLFFVPLVAYIIWQLLYFLIVDVLRRQRLLRDPEVMTSYRFPSFLFSLSSSPLLLSVCECGSCPNVTAYRPGAHSFCSSHIVKILVTPSSNFLSHRELSKKAQKANSIWWRLSGLLGDQNRLFMYILLQAMFTLATTALTVPIFLSYELHVTFQVLKVSAAVWNGGNFLLEVMPRQVILKEKKKMEMHPIEAQLDQSVLEKSMEANNSSEVLESQ